MIQCKSHPKRTHEAETAPKKIPATWYGTFGPEIANFVQISYEIHANGAHVVAKVARAAFEFRQNLQIRMKFVRIWYDFPKFPNLGKHLRTFT